jgi:uncharacterized protein
MRMARLIVQRLLVPLAGAIGSMCALAAATQGPAVDVAYKSHPPLDDPSSPYPGFSPGETLLPAGYTAAPGRRPFSTPTILNRDVAIKLRDGTTVYADVYRPSGTQQAPAILTYGPGGKRNKSLNSVIFTPDASTSGLQARLAQDPAAWVPHGYAVVNVDARGAYRSEGDLQYLGSLNSKDGYDVVEFIAHQPWCNGRVGMSGTFWNALVQWGVAAEQPPHLAAIAPWDAGDNVFRDEFRRGGIAMAQSSIHDRSFGSAREEDMRTMVRLHPLLDQYWLDKIPALEKIRVPVYQTMSFTTMHTNGDLEAFNLLHTPLKWLRVINGHAWMDLHDEASRADLRRFFDRYLKGERNGWERTSRVRLSVLDAGGEDVVAREESSFPLTRQRITRYHLDGAHGRLSEERLQREVPVSYHADSNEKVTFTIKFRHDTEISGYLGLHLWVQAVDAEDMDIFARIIKLDAQGVPLLQDSLTFKYSGPDGRLRVSQRRLDEQRSTELLPVLAQKDSQPLEPSSIVRVDIPIWPTAMRFHAGQQLQLVLAGHDFMLSRPGDRPEAEINNRGIHIVHTGGRYDSYLSVPIIPNGSNPKSKP